jgi:hypothetical protein
MDIWGSSKSLDLDKQYRAQIGPLCLWLKHHFDEIHIAVEYAEDEAVESEAFTFSCTEEYTGETLDWKRWVVGENSNAVSILPIMPDRPIVVRPEVPVKIPEGHEALFFVNIPVWVEIVLDNTEEIALCKEPSIVLSNIWFGDPMSGELCYSLRTKASRQVIDTNPKPHRATCPVRILNTTNSQLDVDRFCVHVEHLNMYKGISRLWTNEVRISFQGEDAVSRIDYAKEQPEYEETDQIISKARTIWKKTLLKRSLGTFRLLTGI